jgi:protein-S-isoprenylcysteine O-methyltransferase Ste14
MNAKQEENPGVRIPPPVIFGAGLIPGFLLQRFFPVEILGDTRGNLPQLLGGVAIILSLSLAVPALLMFYHARTSVRPDRPNDALVTHGIFRLSRNPMYVSLSLAYAGFALSANALWPLLFLLPVLFIIRYFVIAREERYLLSRFGPEYEAYLHSVRRWL